MSRNDENPSKRSLTIAIVFLALAFFALGVAVSLAVPSLRKSSSPTTPVLPFTPSRTPSPPKLSPTTQSHTGKTHNNGGNTKAVAPKKASVSSPPKGDLKSPSPSATLVPPSELPNSKGNEPNQLNEDRD